MRLSVAFTPQQVGVKINSTPLSVATKTPIARVYVDRPAYDGPVEVTPSAETQTLLTENLRMTENITVNPIPSNYGLITYNGAILTVS